MEKPAQVFDKRSGSSLYMFTVLPAPPLRNYIDYYYGEETIIKEYGSRYVPHHLILLPLACVEMHFCYHDTSLLIRSDKAACSFRGLIVGAHNIHTHHIVDNFKDTAKQIHVKFIPGGFHRLLGLRESELQQTFFNTDVVLGSEGKTIEDDLNNSLSTKERIGILDRFFISRMKAGRRERNADSSVAAARWIAEHDGNIRVTQLLSHLGITKRTLDRQFMNHTGLTPKEFARVVRFQTVMKRLLAADSVDWQELVNLYGYYDQSHLIDEFRYATTFPPEMFLRQKGRTVIKYKTGIFLTRPLDAQPATYREIMEETFQSELGRRSGEPGLDSSLSHRS